MIGVPHCTHTYTCTHRMRRACRQYITNTYTRIHAYKRTCINAYMHTASEPASQPAMHVCTCIGAFPFIYSYTHTHLYVWKIHLSDSGPVNAFSLQVQRGRILHWEQWAYPVECGKCLSFRGGSCCSLTGLEEERAERRRIKEEGAVVSYPRC